MGLIYSSFYFFFYLFGLETGSHYGALAGLELLDICLPKPPQCSD